MRNMAQLVTPVEKRVADGQVSFCGDAHDQESFPAQEDVLYGVDEVREDDGIEGIEDIFSKVNEDETQEHYITGSKGNEALVKCGLHSWVSENDDGHNVTQ